MAIRFASVADYRKMLDSGLESLRANQEKYSVSELQSGYREYRRLYGIIDAMAPAERADPLSVIDSRRLRRIADGAGVSDQEVIRFLISFSDFVDMISFSDFVEEMARLEYWQQRSS